MDIKRKFSDRKSSVSSTNSTKPPQLTPTGKISHAKTRVYTQRYRKAWENMPDFKGWLTSVPDQPTRAFCTYCRKNLHAHRLSLLKHTCTMKHQRGALMHQKETSGKTAAATIKLENISQSQDEAETQDDPDELAENSGVYKAEDEDADDDEEIEYVVERLDDDEDIDDEQSKDVEDDTEYVEVEEDDDLSAVKKMKIDDSAKNRSPDALAEAMAHVHGEFLNESGDSVNVDLEMVVESGNPNAQELQIVSVHSEADNEMPEEHLDNDDNFCTDYAHDQEKENDQDHESASHERAGTISSCKSSYVGESSDGVSDAEDPETQMEIIHGTSVSMPVRREYLTRQSIARSVPGSTNNGEEGNGAANSGVKRTITLTAGGKIVTINSSDVTSYTGGSRFVLLKGQAADNLPNEKRKETPMAEGQVKVDQQQQQQITAAPITVNYSSAGGSQSAPRKHIILKSVKPLVPTKKPCISTHVLDTSKGHPVGGLQISLYKLMEGRWTFLNESTTTADGRCADLIDTSTYSFTAGRYKLHFDVDKYFILRRIETIYPFIEIVFDVKNPTEHYHVPLLLSPFGYTTYRGS